MSNHPDIHTLLASSQEEWDILDSLIKDNTGFLNRTVITSNSCNCSGRTVLEKHTQM
ncbi:hypothetical protein DPMN_164777 [Dreissena polymorpha]|uniref:Uncharacterized protein n=1 Tax=Dreissena polymorpha TaxID=45954 RepID=A0A9D4ETJ8_DREPO|nr:hypothetical protein DPMN_164777 [Dreissena polymorpha]